MNKVFLMGRLTRDMIVSATSTGKNIAKGSLAVDDYNNKTNFFNIVAFDKKAEFFEKYGKKGTKFLIEGTITTGSYEKDGVKIPTFDIRVDSVEFAESKKNSDGFTPASDEEVLPFS